MPVSSCDVSLIIPTLNEAANLEVLIGRTHRALTKTGRTFEILIVDDQSPDGTYAKALALMPHYPGLRVLQRTGARDLAQSVVDGWTVATGERLAVMDADLQHPPEVLGALLNALDLDKADIAVGSRYMRGGGVGNWNVPRQIVSWGASLLAGFLFPGILTTVQDPMSGFFAIRRTLFLRTRLQPRGYKILLEVLVRARVNRVAEVPYQFAARQRGQSKLGAGQAYQYLSHLVALSRDTGELRRVGKYLAVGLIGFAVNGATTYAVTLVHAPLVIAMGTGFELSLVHNFLLHAHWTFGDLSSTHDQVESRRTRLLVFHIISLFGLAANLLTVAVLVGLLQLPHSVAALTGIVLGGLCNFFGNTHITWTLWDGGDSRRTAQKPRSVGAVLRRIYRHGQAWAALVPEP